MKPETVASHEEAVRRAAYEIADGMDEAIDLARLADVAGMSPTHFHRVFRRTIGETPLVLHRRLRLERAALELAWAETAVTAIAFAAGYETHEAFTRAFHAAYAAAPSHFRRRMRTHLDRMGRPDRIPYKLPSANGIHVDPGRVVVGLTQQKGSDRMSTEIVTAPELRLATTSHDGPINMVGEAFGRLAQIAGPAGLFPAPDAVAVAVFPRPPEGVASGARAVAGVVVAPDREIPADLSELVVPGGTYARTTHHGDYDTLADTWSRLRQDVEESADFERAANADTYEIYRVADHSRPDELETDLYLPVTRGRRHP